MKARIAATVAAALGVAVLVAAPVVASPRLVKAGSGTPPQPSGTASFATVGAGPAAALFNGRTINLANGWGGAKGCLDFANGTTQCFSTIAEAKAAAEGTSGPVQPITTTPISAQMRRTLLSRAHSAIGHRARPSATSCQNNRYEWFWLYTGDYYTGQALGIQAPDQWVDLAPSGFADAAVSDSNNTNCTVYGIEAYSGAGPWDTISPWSSAPDMGGFDDALVAIYIAY